MLTGFLPSLGGLALAQSQGTGAGIGVVIAVVGVLLAAAGFWRSRTLARDVAAARKQRDGVQETLKAAQARERELAKKGEERQDETRELKQEVAGLRKKNHAAQEELKALRDQLKAQVEERDRLLATRPAFDAPRPEPKPKAKPAPRPEPAARADQPAKADPAPKAEPPRVDPPAANHDAKPDAVAAPSAAADPAVVADLTARVGKLEVAERDLGTALTAEREALKAQKAEVVRLRKYAEQLRRIDMVSKGKVEVLEDKLASLGRQYYETVSELAAIKGEVRPPSRSHDGNGPKAPRRPHDDRRGRGRPEPAQAEPEAHATPDSDSLAAQMEAADAEANVQHEEPTEAAPGRTPTGTEVG